MPYETNALNGMQEDKDLEAELTEEDRKTPWLRDYFARKAKRVQDDREAAVVERAALERERDTELARHAKLKAAAAAKVHKCDAALSAAFKELTDITRAMLGVEHGFEEKLGRVRREVEITAHPAIGNFIDELSELETQLRYSPIEDSLARVAELERLRSARTKARELTFLAVPDMERALADLRATL